MDTTEPHTKAGIKRVEAAGLGMAVVSALAIWGASAVIGAPSHDAAGRHVVLHFFGLSRNNICGSIILLSLLGGSVGLAQLAYGLIGRIPKARIRNTAGWTTFAAAVVASPFMVLTALVVFLITLGTGHQTRFEAANGQSIVVTQDGFDSDSVDIYTEHGRFHYVWNRAGHRAERGPPPQKPPLPTACSRRKAAAELWNRKCHRDPLTMVRADRRGEAVPGMPAAEAGLQQA